MSACPVCDGEARNRQSLEVKQLVQGSPHAKEAVHSGEACLNITFHGETAMAEVYSH